MHIIWYGLSCFKFISRDVTIFTDPFSKAAGPTPPRGAAQIVLSSSPDQELYNNFSGFTGDPFIIDSPGEYDVKGVFFRGISATPGKEAGRTSGLDRRALYTIVTEGLQVGFLGAYPEKMLTEEQLEELEGVDILIIPVGGQTTLGAEASVKIVNQIEPKIVIPMHYKIPGFSGKLEPIDRFIKELGGKGEELDKLLVKKGEWEEEKTRLVILSPAR